MCRQTYSVYGHKTICVGLLTPIWLPSLTSRLEDFNLTTPEFRRVYDYVLGLNPKDERQSVVLKLWSVVLPNPPHGKG